MEFLKKIVHFVTGIVYIMIIVYILVWIPSIFGYKPLVVLSESMEPSLKKGSVIYYKETAKEDIKIGDIITYKGNNGEYISHRVTNIENDLYTTKGDANKISDASKVKWENILGKVMKFCIIYIGYYIKFITDNWYVIAIAIFILILEFILSNFSNNGKKEVLENEK